MASASESKFGAMAEWSCRGLQILVRRFDSGSRLQTQSWPCCPEPLIRGRDLIAHAEEKMITTEEAAEILKVSRCRSGSSAQPGVVDGACCLSRLLQRTGCVGLLECFHFRSDPLQELLAALLPEDAPAAQESG